MAAIFALAASMLWGTSDFTGGVASRRTSSVSVLLVTMPVGLAALLVGALVLGGHPTVGSLGWGALSGLAAGGGVLAFYQAMFTGSMSVVAPVSAMTAAAVPVVAGLALGERPGVTSLIGVGLCLVAITAVSAGTDGIDPADSGTGAQGDGQCRAHSWRSGARRQPGVGRPPEARWRPGARRRPGVALAVVAGGVFGLYFVLLKPVGPSAGLWPLVSSRLVAWSVVVGASLGWSASRSAAVASPAEAALPPSAARFPGGGWITWLPTLSGCLDGGAQILYLSALQHGLLISVAVLASLYPAVTVLMARALLTERLRRTQQLGLAVAVIGVVLTAL